MSFIKTNASPAFSDVNVPCDPTVYHCLVHWLKALGTLAMLLKEANRNWLLIYRCLRAECCTLVTHYIIIKKVIKKPGAHCLRFSCHKKALSRSHGDTFQLTCGVKRFSQGHSWWYLSLTQLTCGEKRFSRGPSRWWLIYNLKIYVVFMFSQGHSWW